MPESAPSRIRSASYQFSGKASQCTGNEPVLIDVYAYAGDGRGNIADANAGTRVGQMAADCKENPAFARPIDVTQIVRQLSVASGVRHLGFNIRKANNRQGPGLFNLSAGKLTVVLADQALAQPPQARHLPAAKPGTTLAGAAPNAVPAQGATMRLPQQTVGVDPRVAAAMASARAAAAVPATRNAIQKPAQP